jgi:hypothetical protein
MLSRTTAVAALGAATMIAAAGSHAATVLVQNTGNEQGLATAAAHRAAQAGQQDDSAPDATPHDAVTPPPCPADVKNHGAYVSSVAKANHGKSADHGKPEASDTTHGALVSAAAQSDCGKDATASDGADENKTETESDDAGDAGDAGQDKAPAGQTHGKAGQTHGQSGSHIPGQAPTAS